MPVLGGYDCLLFVTNGEPRWSTNALRMLLAADRVFALGEVSPVLQDLVGSPIQSGSALNDASTNVPGWSTWLFPSDSDASRRTPRPRVITETSDTFAPLRGTTVFFLRPDEAARKDQHRFALLGAEVRHQPLLDFGPPPDPAAVRTTLNNLSDYHWLVFTSAVGVDRFIRLLREAGKDLRALHALKLATIGPATAAALRRHHLDPDLVPEEYRSERLAEALTPDVRGRRVLLARSDQGRDVLPVMLRPVADVEEIAVYQQRFVDQWEPAFTSDLCSVHAGYVLLTSSNIATQFVQGLPDAARPRLNKELKLITISPITSDALRRAGAEPDLEAEVYSLDGMLEVIVRDRLANLAGGVPGQVEDDGPGEDAENVQGDAGPREGEAEEEVD